MTSVQKLTRFVGFENEEVLVEALQAGNEAAVEFWFAKYKPQLRRLVSSRISGSSAINEVVQESFVSCLQTINLFQGKSGLLTWMQSVTRHEIADYYRRRYAKKFIQTMPLSELLLDSKCLDATASAELVSVVLKQMLAKNRELLLQKYVDCKKVKDIAFEWGRSVKSIESDLFRARQEFKGLWAEIQQDRWAWSKIQCKKITFYNYSKRLPSNKVF